MNSEKVKQGDKLSFHIQYSSIIYSYLCNENDEFLLNGMIISLCGMVMSLKRNDCFTEWNNNFNSFRSKFMGEIRYDFFRTPSQANGQKNYHVRILKPQVLEFEDVKDSLNLFSSVTPGDVSAVVEGISTLLVSQLTSGRRVHINGIGYFSLSVSAPTIDDKQDFDACDIQIKGINFKPDATLMKQMRKQEMHFRRNDVSHSKELKLEDLLLIFENFYAEHDSMSFREFCIITRLPHTTAYRLLKQLCDGPNAIIKHIGPRNASVYIATKYAPWNL